MIDLLSNLLAVKNEEKIKFSKNEEKTEVKDNTFINMFSKEIENSQSNNNEIYLNITVKEENHNDKTIEDANDNKINKEKIESEEKSKMLSFLVNLKGNDKNKDTKLDHKNSINILENIPNEKKFGINNINNIEKSNNFTIRVSELDVKVQEKVKKTLNDIQTGKIDEKTGNNQILNIVLNNNIISKNIDKSKIASIQIEIKDKNISNENKKSSIADDKRKIKNELPILTENEVKKEIKIENSSKNEKSDSITSVNALEKKDQTKDIKTKKIGERVLSDQIKEKDSETKDIKNEIKFELNEVRTTQSNSKERSAEIQKTFSDNREKIFDSIAKNTKIIQGNGETRFSTIMRPEELGRVDFKINIKEGKIDGKLIVQNQESFDFFRNNIEDLRAVFQKSNIELGKLDITLAGAGLNYGEDFSQNNKDQNREFKETVSIGNYNRRIEKTFEENSMNSNANYYSFNDKRVNIFA